MKKTFAKILLLVTSFTFYSLITFADPPGPPGPPNPPGGGPGGPPVGGDIEDGLAVLLVLAIVYAAWKFYTISIKKAGSVS